MGHDITAYKPGVNLNAARLQFRINDHDEEWSDRYELYQQETQVAYLRRGAFNPLSQVIYLALGVMDVYGGCSGDGSTLEITLDQLETAAEVLKVKNFSGMSRESNLADHLLEVMKKLGAVVGSSGDQNGDVSPEKEFVSKCIAHLKATGSTSLEVHFG